MINCYELTSKEEIIAKQVFEMASGLHNINIEDIEIDITIVDAQQIRVLNKESRQIDKPTDVLSFPTVALKFPFNKSLYKFDFNPETNAVYLGEIIICRELMSQQAIEYGHSVERESAFLITHGILHLLGYDHIQDEDRIKMRELEEIILKGINQIR